MKFEMAVPNIYFRTYGASKILDLLEEHNIRSFSLNTIVEELTEPGKGSRFPSMVDRLNRPLDGKDVIYVRNSSSFVPDGNLYNTTKIKPAQKSSLRELEQDTIPAAIAAAKERGFGVSIMDAPLAVPPQQSSHDGENFGYPWWAVVDDEYKALRIDGKRVHGVESKGCPNNPEVRNYAKARIYDIVQNYPGIDLLYVDHIELPTYTFEDNFSCFCEHCVKKSADFGVDLEAIQTALLPYFDKISTISSSELRELFESDSFKELVAWRWKSIKQFLIELREAVYVAGNNAVKFGVTGFTPAFSMFGSRDYSELADICDVVAPKFYPEHWTVVISLWLKELCGNNPNMTPQEALTVIYDKLGWGGLSLPMSQEEISVDSGSLLPMSLIDIEAKRTIKLVAGRAEIQPPVHGWGTLENWKAKLSYLAENDFGGYIWGLFHVTDAQLEAISEVSRGK